jgi:hypothetical protein
MTAYYCESCYEENLKSWLKDCYGTIFCSEECYNDFEEMNRKKNRYQGIDKTYHVSLCEEVIDGVVLEESK